MIQNNNISVLPWYTSINEQNHRKSYAYGAIYPLFAPADRLLPFQIIRNTRSNNVTSVVSVSYTHLDVYKRQALQLVKDGFLAGGDANGEFLDTLKEYPAYFKEAGISADQFRCV